MPSSCPGQVDFPVRQVTFHSHLPNGQGPRQVICQLNCKKSNLRLAQGTQNLRATCPKGKQEFKFFSSPGKSSKFVLCSHKFSTKFRTTFRDLRKFEALLKKFAQSFQKLQRLTKLWTRSKKH